MSNIPAFRLYPSEEARLRREVEKLSHENNELLDRIFELEQQLKAALATTARGKEMA